MQIPSPVSCILKKTEQQEIVAREFGFYWKNIEQILEQITSECLEVKEAYEAGNSAHLQDEIGDLLQAAVCLAVFCQFDPQDTLEKSAAKFQKRYDRVVAFAQQEGLLDLKEKSTEELLNYWQRAKQTV